METPPRSWTPTRLQVKPSSFLRDRSEPTARPYKAHPRDPVLGDQDGPSCHPAREQTVQSVPQGCSAELFKGRDPKTRITHPQNPKHTDPGTLLETHREKTRPLRAGVESWAVKGLNRNWAAVGSAELLDGVVKSPRVRRRVWAKLSSRRAG